VYNYNNNANINTMTSYRQLMHGIITKRYADTKFIGIQLKVMAAGKFIASKIVPLCTVQQNFWGHA